MCIEKSQDVQRLTKGQIIRYHWGWELLGVCFGGSIYLMSPKSKFVSHDCESGCVLFITLDYMVIDKTTGRGGGGGGVTEYFFNQNSMIGYIFNLLVIPPDI